jgi:hypothetical protein
MEKLCIYTSRLKSIRFFAIGCAFAALGWLLWKYSREYNPFGAWLSILWCAVAVLVFFRRALDRRPRLVIDGAGISGPKLKTVKIPWTDIAAAYKSSMYGVDFLCLRLKNEWYYLDAMNPLSKLMALVNARLGFPAIVITLEDTDAEVHVVLEEILRRMHGREKPVL